MVPIEDAVDFHPGVERAARPPLWPCIPGRISRMGGETEFGTKVSGIGRRNMVQWGFAGQAAMGHVNSALDTINTGHRGMPNAGRSGFTAVTLSFVGDGTQHEGGRRGRRNHGARHRPDCGNGGSRRGPCRPRPSRLGPGCGQPDAHSQSPCRKGAPAAGEPDRFSQGSNGIEVQSCASCGLAIEAVVEKEEVKQGVFSALSVVAPVPSWRATSSLSITVLRLA